MADSRGKQFEEKFRNDIRRTFGNDVFFLRLPDQMSKYKYASSNICDFIMYKSGRLFLLECKSHKGNTFPLTNLTQYDKLLMYSSTEGVFAGVTIWFIDHEDSIVYVPIETFKKLKMDGKKSFNIKMIDDPTYTSFRVPSVKRRVFYDSDYSFLLDLEKEDCGDTI